MRARTLCAAAVTAGALAICGLFGSASALPEPSESTLVITAYDSTGLSVVKEMTLKCNPTGGSHIDAHGACAALEEADGEFTSLRPLEIACTLEYQPVTIEVGGNWVDRVVHFDREYSNMCVAGAESEGVFRFPPGKRPVSSLLPVRVMHS